MPVFDCVLSRVLHIQRGVPFSINRFYNLGSAASVQKSMSRLIKDGVVERVARGFYVRPKYLASFPSIKVTTSAEQVAEVWAKENGYKLVSQGLEAAYRLGLQNQAPIKSIYWSNGPSREFKIGNEIVVVRKVAESKLKWAGKPTGTLLRGLLVLSPESIEIGHIENAFQRLSVTRDEALIILHRLGALSALNHWKPKLESCIRRISQMDLR